MVDETVLIHHDKYTTKKDSKRGIPMSDTALLVIDVQVCNFEGSAPVYKGGELLSTIGALVARAREAEVLVVYIQHCGSKGAIDEPDTSGWEIHPAMTLSTGDVVVHKWHPDAFQDTNLQSELELRCIKKIVITGIQTEYCVDTTCRRAYSRGYQVVLVKDAHSTWDTDCLTASQIIAHHNEVLGGWFAEVKEADKIDFNVWNVG